VIDAVRPSLPGTGKGRRGGPVPAVRTSGGKASGADIEELGTERCHRTLAIVREGGKKVR